ncbi:MAG: ABC transporter permease, partial [Geminicoccaceae bacterium]
IGGTWISGLPNTLSFLIRGAFLGIPAGAWIIAVIYGLCWLLLRWTPWGRHVVAVGCDERAARLAGVRVERVKIGAYALLGLLAGVAAVLYVARLRNIEVNIGTNVALEAIAATVLGGASIRGGVGSLLGALLGVLFIKVMQNGLVLVGVSSLWETVVIGGLLLTALASDAMVARGSVATP